MLEAQNVDFSLVLYVFRHSYNEIIDLSLVLCVFRALRQAVWGSWLALSGLSGLAGWAVAVGSSRGPNSIEFPRKSWG